MLLHPYSTSTDGYRFILPSGGEGTLNLLPQQELAFACPLGGLYEHARCVSGTVNDLHQTICICYMYINNRGVGKTNRRNLNIEIMWAKRPAGKTTNDRIPCESYFVLIVIQIEKGVRSRTSSRLSHESI